jgi:hypothetical protein
MRAEQEKNPLNMICKFGPHRLLSQGASIYFHLPSSVSVSSSLHLNLNFPHHFYFPRHLLFLTIFIALCIAANKNWGSAPNNSLIKLMKEIAHQLCST